MTEAKQSKTTARWPVVLAVGLLAAFGAIFLIEFVAASYYAPQLAEPEELTEETYSAEVEALLADADASRGEQLVEVGGRYECGACHIAGAPATAPPFEGLAERAADERPPLTAAAYIYEAIVNPAIHVVEGYPNSMPGNYHTRLSDEELGDILAYLLEQ